MPLQKHQIPEFLRRTSAAPPPMPDPHRQAVLALTNEEATNVWQHCRDNDPTFPELQSPTEGDHSREAHGLLLAAIAHGNGQAHLVISTMRDNTATANSALEKLIGKPITRKTTNPNPPASKFTRPNPRAKKWDFNPDHKVRLLVPSNPKKPGAAPYARFALYENDMLVSTALALGVLPADIVWDRDHNFIALEA